MRSESPLSGPTECDSVANIEYNFEGAALTGKSTNEKYVLTLLHSFFCILFSTQNCKYFWEVEVEVNEIKNTNYRH